MVVVVVVVVVVRVVVVVVLVWSPEVIGESCTMCTLKPYAEKACRSGFGDLHDIWVGKMARSIPLWLPYNLAFIHIRLNHILILQ